MELTALGYLHPRRLESGEIAALTPMIYTVGLCIGLTADGYRSRFCYPDYQSAMKALDEWDGFGTPPGPYITQKGLDLSLVERSETSTPRMSGVNRLSNDYRN